MTKLYLIFLLIFPLNLAHSQTNILVINDIADQVLKGNYNAADFQASIVIDQPSTLVDHIETNISADSLKSYLEVLSSFGTRNTGSDTVSTTRGIGASRRWVHSKFQDISAENENRLLPGYLQFDQDICDMGQHRNVISVLPGSDDTDNAYILIEAHMDSRCDTVCGIVCDAHGMEDNGSGTALVIELARVMSALTLEHTVVFMATIGEEQGLLGANAFAEYSQLNSIPVKAVLNNDIVGGILCGETSSEPSCPGLNHVDSTQVRIFSAGSSNSPHKSLARFIKLQYADEVLPTVAVPMQITLMSATDRTGRGGDHIPFHERGFTAVRFTSANEHGSAAVGPDYHDRQHTSDDILGVDTNGDMIIDSFFVDFNYLARNAVINGVGAAMAAIGPESPLGVTTGFFQTSNTFDYIIDDPLNLGNYRIGVRNTSNDFDTLVNTTSLTGSITVPSSGFHYISVASIDDDGIESLFSGEFFFVIPGTVAVENLPERKKHIELLQNRPNPFDEATYISFFVHNPLNYNKAFIIISDLMGREIERIPTPVQQGMNEILYTHGYNALGTFVYALEIDGQIVDSKRMIFAY